MTVYGLGNKLETLGSTPKNSLGNIAIFVGCSNRKDVTILAIVPSVTAMDVPKMLMFWAP